MTASTDDSFDDEPIEPQDGVDLGEEADDGADDVLADPAGSFAVLEDAAAAEVVAGEYGEDDDFLGYQDEGARAPIEDESTLTVVGDPYADVSVADEDELGESIERMGATDPDLVDDRPDGGDEVDERVLDDQELEDALRFDQRPGGAELDDDAAARLDGTADPTVQSEDFGGNALTRPEH